MKRYIAILSFLMLIDKFCMAGQITLRKDSLKSINEITLSHGYFNEEVDITNPTVTLGEIIARSKLGDAGCVLNKNAPVSLPVGKYTLKNILRVVTEQNNILVIYGNGGYLFFEVAIENDGGVGQTIQR